MNRIDCAIFLAVALVLLAALADGEVPPPGATRTPDPKPTGAPDDSDESRVPHAHFDYLDTRPTKEMLGYDGAIWPPAAPGFNYHSGQIPGIASFSLLVPNPKDPKAYPSACSATVIFNRFASAGAKPASAVGFLSMDELARGAAFASGGPDCKIATARHCFEPYLAGGGGETKVKVMGRQFSEGLDHDETVEMTAIFSQGGGTGFGSHKPETDGAVLLGYGDVCRKGLAKAKVVPPCPTGKLPGGRLVIDSLRSHLPLVCGPSRNGPPDPLGSAALFLNVVQPDGEESKFKAIYPEMKLGTAQSDSGTGVRLITPDGKECLVATLMGGLGPQIVSGTPYLGTFADRKLWDAGVSAGPPPKATVLHGQSRLARPGKSHR